jgi:hypothetical protein
MRTHSTVEQFVTGGPAMTCYYLVVNDEVDVKSTPVIGWIVKRDHYENDVPEDDEILPAVLNTEFFTAEPAREVYGNSGNTELIGIYPDGTEAPDDDVTAAENLLLERLNQQWRETEKFAEPHRTRRRTQIEVMGKALKAMIDAGGVAA